MPGICEEERWKQCGLIHEPSTCFVGGLAHHELSHWLWRYMLASSLSICHAIPSIPVWSLHLFKAYRAKTFRAFANLTDSRLHLHIYQYQVLSQLLRTAINIACTISSSQPSDRLTPQINSPVSASMADLLCSRCRVTISISTFEQAFTTKPAQHNTTFSKANKENLAQLGKAVHPHQQISCYQQQPEHAEPFNSMKTPSGCVRCGVCRL